MPEEALEKDAYPEVNNLIKQYYQALVDGDMETIRNIKNYTDDEEELKNLFCEFIDENAMEYIDDYLDDCDYDADEALAEAVNDSGEFFIGFSPYIFEYQFDVFFIWRGVL